MRIGRHFGCRRANCIYERVCMEETQRMCAEMATYNIRRVWSYICNRQLHVLSCLDGVRLPYQFRLHLYHRLCDPNPDIYNVCHPESLLLDQNDQCETANSVPVSAESSRIISVLCGRFHIPGKSLPETRMANCYRNWVRSLHGRTNSLGATYRKKCHGQEQIHNETRSLH